MRLLFVTSRLPFPADRGDRLRTFNFLQRFSTEHEVTLVSFTASAAERGNTAELQPFCKSVHLVDLPPWQARLRAATGIIDTEPLQMHYYRSRMMQRKIEALLADQPFDAAYVHLFRMAPYLRRQRSLYRVLDLTDLISMELAESTSYRSGAQRIIYRQEQSRVRNYELEAASWYDETWFISARDRDLFVRRGSAANLQVIPNGVSRALFDLDRRSAEPGRLLFVGHLEVAHNIDAVRYLALDIMPRIRQGAPQAVLRIVGAGNEAHLRDLEKMDGVELVGFVPNLQEELSRAAVFVAPLRFSAGVQNKVLEALAAGMPVVTSDAVSDGLGTMPGEHLLVADSAGDYAALVLRLLSDQGRAEQLGRVGRAFVREHYRWQTALQRLRLIEAELN